MYVKLLIGQLAGQIVDMPDHAATNLLTTGQAERPSEAEIAEKVEADRKAMMPKAAPDIDEPGTVIHEVKSGRGAGLKIVVAGEGRFNVVGIGGAVLNESPLARSEALLFAADPPREKVQSTKPVADEPPAAADGEAAAEQEENQGSKKKKRG